MAFSRTLQGVLGVRDPRGRLLVIAFLIAGLVVVGVVVAEKVGDARFEREVREAEDVLLGRTAGDGAEAASTLDRLLLLEVVDPHDRLPRRVRLLLENLAPALRAGLASPDARTRAASANAAGTFALATVGVGGMLLLPELSALVTLPDPDERVQLQAVRALAHAGEPAEDALLAGLAAPRPEVRAECLAALGALDGRAPPRRLAAMVAATSDPDPRVRGAAIGALRQGGPASKAALPAIAARFADADLAVRLAAVGAVRDIGADAATARALVPAAADASADVRADALEAMGTVRPGAADLVRPAIEAALRDPDEAVRAAARRALSRVGAR